MAAIAKLGVGSVLLMLNVFESIDGVMDYHDRVEHVTSVSESDEIVYSTDLLSSIPHGALERKIAQGKIRVLFAANPDPAPKALAIAGLRVVQGGLGRPVDVSLDPRAKYEALAAAPGLVCVKRENGCWVGFVGDEPRDLQAWRTDRRWLGHGGQGYALVDGFGEVTVTHNLSGDEWIPEAFWPLFEPTHVRRLQLTNEQERAYWAERSAPVAA